jgi:hypothetical protein
VIPVLTFPQMKHSTQIRLTDQTDIDSSPVGT